MIRSDPAGESEPSTGMANGDRAERLTSLIKSLEADIKELEALGLTLPAALLDNACELLKVELP